MRSDRQRRWWPRASAHVEVVVYTHRGCGLCRQAEMLVAREAAGCAIKVRDVDEAPQLATRYSVRVPVVTVDGREVAALQVGRGSIRRAVRRSRWGLVPPSA